MASSSKYFDVEDFNRGKRKQGSTYRPPPRQNYIAAANYVRNFFDDKKMNWAAMLTLAMACLGSRREMADIHIAYDDRDFQRIKLKLESNPRVRLPKGMNSLFPSKLLIATGPKYKDAGCTDNVEVEVDLVPPGAQATPQNNLLRNNQVMLRLNHGGNTESYKGLNMLYLVKTMIAYCNSQDLVWDPKVDVLFLCQSYATDIGAVRAHLDARQVQENFLSTAFVLRLPPNVRRQCYHVLLGADKEPPPSMSLTPAPPIAHRPTASAPDIHARPPIPSHKSSPSLNTMQQSSSFLSPPLPGKLRKQQPTSQSAPPTQPSLAKPPAQTSAPPQATTTAQNITAKPLAERDSRSRYRHTSTSSAPNGIHQATVGAHASRGGSRERAPQQHGELSLNKGQTINDQPTIQARNMSPCRAPAPMPAHSVGMRPQKQKSMPSLAGHQPGAVPVFAHSRNDVPPVPKAALPVSQAVGSAVSPPANTSQRTQSHFGPQAVPHQQSRGIPRPSEMSNIHYAAAQPLPHYTGQEAEVPFAGGPRRIQAPSQHFPAPHAGTTMNSGGMQASPVTPIQLPHRSQHGIPQVPQEKYNNASTFIFELDASPTHNASPPAPAPNDHFVAELPAQEVSRSTVQNGHVAVEQANSAPPLPNSQPVSSRRNDPTGTILASLKQSPQHEATQVRPHISQYQSSSLDSLPPSLMIGAGRHSPKSSNSSISQSPSQLANSPPKQPNYQSHRSSPYFDANNAKPHPNQAPVSLYKAYSIPVSPPVQPTEVANKAGTSPQMVSAQAYPCYEQNPTAQAQAHATPNRPTVHPSVLMNANPPAQSACVSYQSYRKHAIKDSGVACIGDIRGPTNYALYAAHVEVRPVEQQPDQQPRYSQNYPVQPISNPYLPQAAAAGGLHQHPQPGSEQWRPLFEPKHQRNTSHDSQNSTTSHDSLKLAEEYQADLVGLDNRFGK